MGQHTGAEFRAIGRRVIYTMTSNFCEDKVWTSNAARHSLDWQPVVSGDNGWNLRPVGRI